MAERKSRNRRGGPKPEEQVKMKKSLVGSLLDLPQAPLSALTQIELLSNREALVEGCRGVVEYNENFIRLNMGRMTVRFCGRDLQLRSMSEESVVIEGFIQSVEFIT